MDPNVGLRAASGLVSFLLKTTLEWLVCLAVVRLASSARWRFNLWLTMLAALVGQWIWTWADVARPGFAALHTVSPAVLAVHEKAPSEIVAVAPQTAGVVTQTILVLLAVYAAVLLWCAAGAVAARVRLARAMRFRRAPSERLAAVFSEVIGEAQASGRDLTDCELWVLPSVSSPAIIGSLRPCVIVPPSCEGQNDAELRAAFWHELKHVERRDALWNILVNACRSLLWFHPVVRHATQELHKQRELACDAAVIREHPQSRDVYASCLLRFARTSAESALPAIEIASGPSLLAMRIRSILDEAPGLSRLAVTGRGAANLLLVAATAATVPALNVLFSTQMRMPVVQIPVTNVTAADVIVRTKRAVLRAGGERVRMAATQTGSAPPMSVQFPMQHDEALAAEHRAAMGIVTESTGMDGTAPAEESASVPGQPGRPSNAAMPASWGKVAIDVAERVGPLMNDHDADNRH